MRASELLRYRVVTADGRVLGRVTDLRIVQDGPLVAGIQQAFRVDALVVGKGGLADRLGYLRGRVEAPWIVATVMRRLERRALVVDVADVQRWDDRHGRLVLRVDAPSTHLT